MKNHAASSNQHCDNAEKEDCDNAEKEDLHGGHGAEFLLPMASYEPEPAYLLKSKEGALQECLYIAEFSLLI